MTAVAWFMYKSCIVGRVYINCYSAFGAHLQIHWNKFFQFYSIAQLIYYLLSPESVDIMVPKAMLLLFFTSFYVILAYDESLEVVNVVSNYYVCGSYYYYNATAYSNCVIYHLEYLSCASDHEWNPETE